jgi:predicted nuclease of predicted toxin-antitoxin system
MRFLLIGQPPLTPAVAEALVRHGHQPVALDSIGLTADSPKEQIINQAEKSQLDILTTDADLIEAPYQHDLWFKRTIIFLQLKGGDVEQDDAIDRLFTRYKRLNPRHLYTVTETRVKTRQLPGPK